MDSVECVGHVNRGGNLAKVRAVAVEPLARSVNDCLASIGRLDTELERLEDQACTLGDEVHSDLTREAADGQPRLAGRDACLSEKGPVHATTPDLALVAKYMLPSATRGRRKNESGKRQEVCPRFEIPMCNHVSQSRDQAPGPSIPGALRYRSAKPSGREANERKQRGQRPLKRRLSTRWETSQVLKPCPRSQSIGMSPVSCPAWGHRCEGAWN